MYVYSVHNIGCACQCCILSLIAFPGEDPVGGSRRGQDPPPLFGGPSNFIKREKKRYKCVCVRKHCVLLLNSNPDPPPHFRIDMPLLSNIFGAKGLVTNYGEGGGLQNGRGGT